MTGAEEIISALVRGNEDYSASTPNRSFEELQEGQSPKVTLVSCSDSRLSSRIFSLDPTNYIFHIRNIGNQVSTAEGSVDYGIMHLRTPLLMILGHTGCGAVKAALSDYSGEKEPVRRELDTLKAGLGNKFDDPDPVLRETKYAEQNVDFQVRRAVEKYKSMIDSGKLVIAGAMLDFHDVYSENRGAVFVTNINGCTDPSQLEGMLKENKTGAAGNSIKRAQ